MKARVYLLVVLLLAVVAVPARADDTAQILTLPAAASIVGVAPFFSDVRAFNTSYTDSLNVTANYRCFIPATGCVAATPTVPFTLAPRESRAFNDIVAQTFGAPNTAGGVEFSFTGESEQLVITSRLYSPPPTPTVGMFIPGLSPSDALMNTVLLSVQNGGSGQGFRTNVGVFNPNDAAVTVTFQIFDAGSNAIGNAVPMNVAPHNGAQINAIFTAASSGSTSTDNAVVRVNASAPVFSYAAVIDNNTTDPIFVVGAEDQPPQAVQHSTRTVQVGPGGQHVFMDDQSGDAVTTINPGDTVTWVWSDASTSHGVDSGRCNGDNGYYGGGGGCTSDGEFSSGIHEGSFSFSHTFNDAGAFPYFCDVHQGSMTGRVVVQAPAAGSTTRRAVKRARR